MIIKTIIEFIFSFALFINALLFAPQAIRILRKKTAKGVSLFTFSGFLLIQFTIVLHGLITHDYLLASGYILSMLTCGSVVILIIIYNMKQGLTSQNDLSLDEIIKQLPAHVYWKNKEGICLGSNTNNWSDFGLNSLNEFIGKTDYDIFSKEEAGRLKSNDQEVMRTNTLIIAEEELTNDDGSKILYLSHKSPLKNARNEIIGIAGVSVDITSSKRKTVERLEMLENIIAAMPGHVYWLNKEGIYLGCNDNQATAIGLKSRKEIVGKRNKDIPGFLIPEVLDPINQRVMQTGETITIEEPAILGDGTEATFLSSKVPLRNRQNEIIGMLGISLDITDRKRAEKELKEAKEAAEVANRVKSEFLFNMRHDLRTPFSGILGIAEFMENNEADPAKKENLGYITQSARVLLDHLNEIFEFVHAETGQLPILEKQFDLHELLDNTHKMMTPSAKGKDLAFNVLKEENLPQFVMGDQVRTQRILINLITNGIKFTEKGHVNLHVKIAKRSKKKMVIKYVVEDTGIGIPEEKSNLLFEQFNRLTSSYSGIFPGKGLGLRMVKTFLDEIGGEVHLKSQLGIGSTFKVLIPYRESLLDCPEELL